eukprot:6231977-Ditylum_brightwellii.AAC.1
MPSNKKKSNKKSKSKKGGGGMSKTNKKTTTTNKEEVHNFVSEAGPGCYIAHHPQAYALVTSPSSTLPTPQFLSNENTQKPNWMYGWESFLPADYKDDKDDFSLTDIPDVAINPETHLLTA